MRSCVTGGRGGGGGVLSGGAGGARGVARGRQRQAEAVVMPVGRDKVKASRAGCGAVRCRWWRELQGRQGRAGRVSSVDRSRTSPSRGDVARRTDKDSRSMLPRSSFLPSFLPSSCLILDDISRRRRDGTGRTSRKARRMRNGQRQRCGGWINNAGIPVRQGPTSHFNARQAASRHERALRGRAVHIHSAPPTASPTTTPPNTGQAHRWSCLLSGLNGSITSHQSPVLPIHSLLHVTRFKSTSPPRGRRLDLRDQHGAILDHQLAAHTPSTHIALHNGFTASSPWTKQP